MARHYHFGISAIAAFLCTSASPALAQESNVQFGPIPEWADLVEPADVPENQRGVLFLRRGLTQIHLSEGAQQTFTLSHAKVLHPNALQLGNVAIVWNPALGSPIVHRLAIIRDGEAIDVLENTEFEILRREDQLEAARLDGLLTASLRVPDLRVGDEIEFAYTIPSGNPSLLDHDFGLMFIASEPPPGRVQLRLSWDDDETAPLYQLTPDLEDIAQIEDRSVTIGGDGLASVTPPRFAPPRYGWQRIVQFTDFADWQSVSARFNTLFDEARALSADSPVAAEAARIARAHDTDLARARAALDLVTQQTRYIYVGLNDGAFTPATAEETWDRRYGDCKGKTALLLALLDELNIPAEAVLVSNRGADDGLEGRLPSPGVFDHVLVRATIDGKQYWLDGTLPGAALPTERPLLPYRWVLPLSDASAELEQVEWHPRELPGVITLLDIDASAGFDESAERELSVITRGIAGLIEYSQYSTVTDDQLTNAFRNELAGSSEWDSIDAVEWEFNREQQASILRVRGTGPVEWDGSDGGRRDFVLPGGGFNPPQRRQRSSEQDQSAPYITDDRFNCNVTTVHFPASTKAREWSHNSLFDTEIFGTIYRRMYQREDRSIRMITLSRTEQLEVSPERAEEDNARISRFDNSMGRIYYTPGENWRVQSRLTVPAVADVDWVENPYACDPQYGYRD